MLKNYIIIAFRQLLKNKLSAFINILGLATGLAIVCLIIAYTYHETSFDKWISDSDNIYRVYRQWGSDRTRANTITPTPLAGALRTDLPEVIGATSLRSSGEILVRVGNEAQYVDQIALIDSVFFKTIPLAFRQGQAQSAVENKFSAILTANAALRLFGREDVIGESFVVNEEDPYTITGILEEPKGPTHLDYEIYLYADFGQTAWTGGYGNTYARFRPSSDRALLEEKMTSMANQYVAMEEKARGRTVNPDRLPKWLLQPLNEVHLKSTHLTGSTPESGDWKKVSLFILLGIIVLGLASINYVNLAMALAFKRSKETGVRKVAGATKGQVLLQFLVEAILQSAIALSVAVILAELFLAAFNEITFRNLDLNIIWSTPLLFLLIGITIVLGLLAGSYPAFYLSNIRPVLSIKGESHKKNRKKGIGLTARQSLVITQFSTAIVLAVAMVFIWKQLNFMLNTELGFNDDQVVLMALNSEESMERFKNKKPQLKGVAGVMEVSQSERKLGEYIPNYTMSIEGTEGNPSVNIFFTDSGLQGTLDLELAEGRFFDNQYTTDTAKAFIVNEAFVKAYQLDQPIGKRLKFVFDESYGSVVGVVKDFHYAGLDRSVQPLILSARQDLSWLSTVAIKVQASNIQQTLRNIEQFWQQIEPTHPFRYSFLDEEFASQYEQYKQLGQTIFYVAMLSILVALLGLFGLASFMAEKRTKELGIRKVFGADVTSLVLLLAKDYLRLVIIAGLIALPISYYLILQWLQNFAYQTNLSAWPFLLVLLGVLILVLATVGFKAFRKATVNPIETLRYE